MYAACHLLVHRHLPLLICHALLYQKRHLGKILHCNSFLNSAFHQFSSLNSKCT